MSSLAALLVHNFKIRIARMLFAAGPAWSYQLCQLVCKFTREVIMILLFAVMVCMAPVASGCWHGALYGNRVC